METSPDPQKAPIKKKRAKQGCKLIASAEVSPVAWDAMEKRVDSGEFKTRSDLVRTAIYRYLGL